MTGWATWTRVPSRDFLKPLSACGGRALVVLSCRRDFFIAQRLNQKVFLIRRAEDCQKLKHHQDEHLSG